jgi:hypothetical protein
VLLQRNATCFGHTTIAYGPTCRSLRRDTRDSYLLRPATPRPSLAHGATEWRAPLRRYIRRGAAFFPSHVTSPGPLSSADRHAPHSGGASTAPRTSLSARLIFLFACPRDLRCHVPRTRTRHFSDTARLPRAQFLSALPPRLRSLRPCPPTTGPTNVLVARLLTPGSRAKQQLTAHDTLAEPCSHLRATETPSRTRNSEAAGCLPAHTPRADLHALSLPLLARQRWVRSDQASAAAAAAARDTNPCS